MFADEIQGRRSLPLHRTIQRIDCRKKYVDQVELAD